MNKKNVFIIFIIILIIGISVWKFGLPKEKRESIGKEDISSYEDKKNLNWRALKDDQFSINYLSTWKEKELEGHEKEEIPEDAEIIGNFWTEEPPQSCNETILKQPNVMEQISDKGGLKEAIENSIKAQGYSLIKSDIELSPKGEKYIYAYEFLKDNVKNKVWDISFNCGNYSYQIGLSCRGEEYIKKYSSTTEEIINSVSCERKTKEAEEKIQMALEKLAQAKRSENRLKKEENIDDAIRLAREATYLDVGNPEIWFSRGNIYFEMNEIGPVINAKETAIYFYQKAIKLDPTNSIYQERLREAEKK